MIFWWNGSCVGSPSSSDVFGFPFLPAQSLGSTFQMMADWSQDPGNISRLHVGPQIHLSVPFLTAVAPFTARERKEASAVNALSFSGYLKCQQGTLACKQWFFCIKYTVYVRMVMLYTDPTVPPYPPVWGSSDWPLSPWKWKRKWLNSCFKLNVILQERLPRNYFSFLFLLSL